MRAVNDLADELSEADLAVFGVEDREDMAPQSVVGSIGYNLDALPDRQAFLTEAARHIAHSRRSQHPLCFAIVAFDHGTHGVGAEGHTAEEAFLREATAPWRDVLRMVQEIDHLGVRVHLDTGCIALGGDAIGEAIHESNEWIGHFHAAQPQLAGFSVPAPNHAEAAAALAGIGYNLWLSIEMREQPEAMASLGEAVRRVKEIYALI